MADTKTYRGNCHCGAFVYEIDVPEIKTVGDCDCSICVRKAYLWVVIGPEQLRVVKGDIEALRCYTFGPEIWEHRFCGHCASAVLARNREHKGVGINAHTLQDFDTWAIEKTPLHNKDALPTYEAPPHKGPLPESGPDNGKVQFGSCHCGRVTFAVNVPVVDSTYPDKILICNCSICEHGGYIWLYPPPEQITLHATSDPSDISRYHFAKGMLNKTFCRNCGVPMTNQHRPLPPAEEAALSEWHRAWIPKARRTHAANARVLDGIDVASLPEFERSNGKEYPPLYVNP